MRTSFKLALAGSLIAFTQFASAAAMPMQQSIELHPARSSHVVTQAQQHSDSGLQQLERLHQDAGPGSMAG
ncbi:hypothetical protein R0381_000814 [Jeongeupia wiesaeckerbachi]|uniref:hypothetical protein n=1 Tax=Jeongeupia wiesaeckerbachi TaxID=3051218 RepID=UPI003D80835D